MTIVLAIDAAWTANQPSGIAVLDVTTTSVRYLMAAPNYTSFLAAAGGHPIDWESGRFPGTVPDVRGIIDAASSLAGHAVELVAIDMPISKAAIVGRRNADNAISTAFGAMGCSTHSPNEVRPGNLGWLLTKEFKEAGFPIAAAGNRPGTLNRLIEVYPHPALLTLLSVNYRFPYKISRSLRYWGGQSVRERIANLIGNFQVINDAITRELGRSNVSIPISHNVQTLNNLKRYEDALDALICGWVASRYVRGYAKAYGDSEAAVWCPI